MNDTDYDTDFPVFYAEDEPDETTWQDLVMLFVAAIVVCVGVVTLTVMGWVAWRMWI